MQWVVREIQDRKAIWDVLDALGLPSFALNADFTIADTNASVQRHLSYLKEDLAGSSLFDIVTVPRPQGDRFVHGAVTTEGTCRKKDRETFAARVTFIRQPEGFVAVVENTSDIQRLARRAEQRSREIATYNALARTLSRSSEPMEMTRGVLDTLVSAMSIDAAWLYLTEEDSGVLSLCCSRGAEDKAFEGAKALKPYECFIGRVLSSGRALLVKDAREDPRITHLKVREVGLRSVAGVPLMARNIGQAGEKAVGVLGVASRTENRFSSLDMQFLAAVGNQLGVAVDNARLLGKVREKMEQIALINEISSVLNSSLSIGHIFRLVVSEVKRTVDFDRASITLLEERTRTMRIFALDTEMPTKLTRGVKAPREGTSASWVTTHQKPWINRDLRREMAFPRDAVLRREGIRSTVSVPLFTDKPLGALNFDSVKPEQYSERDLEVLLPVAKHLSIALENALLFEEISREKREWEKTFDSITDMVWIEDLSGKVFRANRAVAEKTGLAEASVLGRTSGELFEALKITNIPSSEPLGTEGRRYRELNGARGNIYHYWTYPLRDSDGNVYGIVTSMKDVTEQKRLEQQLLRASKLAALGTLVAGIAHEVNNPLGIIAGYSEALLSRARDPELNALSAFEDFPEYLETINKEIFRCKDILKSLLDFARPSSGTFREIDINETLKEVILLVQHTAKKQQQTIALELDRDIPKTAADPGALRQLFLNIVMNSFSFMDSRGTITIGTALETDPYDNPVIHIWLSDTGRGIPKEIIDSIFDPFFTTKPAGEGTGLGLSICHRIVSEHEGTIDVQSKPGSGTTFHIRIPVRSVKPAGRRPAEKPEGSPRIEQ